MKKVLKYLGFLLLSVCVLLAAFVLTIYLVTESRWKRVYETAREPVEVSSDPEVIAHGQHLFTIRGCTDCHGANLGGKIFLEDPMVGRFVASNLTTGAGGIGANYTDEDIVRAIRKGVKPNGRPTLFMPSHEYHMIHQRDMDAMISYLRSVEPVDNVLPPSQIALPMRALYLIGGKVNLFPAEHIDHGVRIPLEEPDTVVARGQYLATTCIGCHGPNYQGGPIPGAPPHWPHASNLTPDGMFGAWTEADFFRAMREGITPEGRRLQNEYMPYETFGKMTDEELHAVFVYLQSLPRQATVGQ